MITIRSLTLAAALAGLPAAAPGQVVVEAMELTTPDTLTAPPVTPSDYLKLYRKSFQTIHRLGSDSYQIRDDSVFNALRLITRTLARTYATKFAIDSVAPEELRSLAELFKSAELPDSASKALRMFVSRVDSDSLRSLGLQDLLQTAPADEVTGLLSQLDRLGGSPESQIRSRSQVLWRGNVPVDLQRRLIDDVVALLNQLPDSAKKINAFAIGNMFESAIVAAQASGQPAVADSLIALGMASLSSWGDLSTRGIRQLALIGKIAPTLNATNWLNAPPGQTGYDPQGKLTLLMITAHW